MSKRGENIHKRKDGRWEARYQKGRHPDGRIIYGSVYGKTYREAKEKVRDAATLQADKLINKNQERYFGEVLFLWMENNRIRLKGGSVKKYQYLIDRHILPSLGGMKLSQITSTAVNSFLAQKLNNGRLDKSGSLSASYVRGIMLIINAALEFAANENMCTPLKNPIYKPIALKKDIQILKPEEQKRLEAMLSTSNDPTAVGIYISLHTGIRIGEICALSWKDIDIENHVIHIRHTVARVKSEDGPEVTSGLMIDTPKTKASSRDIPISSTLMPVLKAVRSTSVSEYVVSDNAGFVSPRTYEYRFHRILDECGVESINYHALRHTFATRCIEAGVDVKSLSEILGHSNVSVTLNTYVHSSMEMKRSQLEKLAEVI